MKPMKASAVTDLATINYPVMVSPKLDGVRAIVKDGVVLSNSLKPIPNKTVQKLFGVEAYNGLDGELVVGPPTHKDVYRMTTSGVMTRDGTPDVRLFVFDSFINKDLDYKIRLRQAMDCVKTWGNSRVRSLRHKMIKNMSDLVDYEMETVNAGYEGVMIRDPYGPYKYGRSTLKEGWLMKLKRFEDSEAMIVGWTELMGNTNEAKTNELGYKARSHQKAGMVGKRMVGALVVRDLKTKIEFEVGTGFKEEDRKDLWITKHTLAGQIIKYRFFPGGIKDKPRFPVFLGFRDPIDM